MKIIYVILLLLILFPEFSYTQAGNIEFRTSRTFKAPEARQGVAVDSGYFYAVNSTSIGKYSKKSGNPLIVWKDTTGSIIHLDGGVVTGDELFCAHSNYPGIPMTSSIEIFSAKDLRHIGSHSFGIKYGSCVWADFHDNYFWVCFGNYDQFRKQTGYGSEGTVLVRFDMEWNERGSWVFPESIISEIRPMSVSGGSWGPDSRLYVTGHDSAEVYILQLPHSGSIMEHVQTVKIASHGQGIAWDRSGKNVLYGIIRKDNSVILSEQVSAAH